MRRSGLKCALHDPFEENALLLHVPLELSAHEMLTLSKYVCIYSQELISCVMYTVL